MSSHEPSDRTSAALPRRGLAFVLAISAAMLVWANVRADGYQLGDSVEYMDRAWVFVRGDEVGDFSIRSFAFSAMLSPIFWVAKTLGVEDLRLVVGVVRLLEGCAALFCVAAFARIVGRMAGGTAGLTAALFLGLNPIFLRYGAEPLTATVTMLGVALGFGELFVPRPGDPRDFRSGARAGAWFGLSTLVAYQTVPVAGVLILCGLLRDRLKRRGYWGGLFTALFAFVVLGGLLDLFVYEDFAISLRRYLGANIGGILCQFFFDLGLYSIGGWFYETLSPHEGIRPDFASGANRQLMQRMPRDWYLKELTSQLLSVPALAVVVLGALAALRRISWTSVAVLGALVVNVFLLSQKGAKSFRLWMPLLPLVTVLFGLGVAALANLRPLPERLRTPVAWAAGLLAVLLGLPLFADTNLSKYGGFWRAMDEVAERAEQRGETVTVASPFYWAVLFRDRAGVEHEKLPADLGVWDNFKHGRREQMIKRIQSYDYFVTHLPIITGKPRLMVGLDRAFRVAATYWDPDTAEQFGPVLLLERVNANGESPVGEPGLEFFEQRALAPEQVDEHRSTLDHAFDVAFTDGDFALRFLGTRRVRDAGEWKDGRGAWLEYHWYVESSDSSNRDVRDRLVVSRGRAARDVTGRAYGAVPTASVPEGTLIVERHFVMLPPDAANDASYPIQLQLGVYEPQPELRDVQDETGDYDAPPPPPRVLVPATGGTRVEIEGSDAVYDVGTITLEPRAGS